MTASTDTRMFRADAIEIAKALVAELEGTYDRLVDCRVAQTSPGDDWRHRSGRRPED